MIYNQATFNSVLIAERDRLVALHEDEHMFVDVVYDKEGNLVLVDIETIVPVKIYE